MSDNDVRAERFRFDGGALPVPDRVTQVFDATWADIAAPGHAWTGAEKVAIASSARAGRLRGGPATNAPSSAAAVAHRLGAGPAIVTERWARQAIEELGEVAYIELVGIVSMLAAVDTYLALLGRDPAELPKPVPGDPVPLGEVTALKHRSGWVATAGPRGPHHALSGVPSIQAAVNRLLDRLYIDRDDIGSLGPVRGLSRQQVELVVLAVSHGNECFY